MQIIVRDNNVDWLLAKMGAESVQQMGEAA